MAKRNRAERAREKLARHRAGLRPINRGEKARRNLAEFRAGRRLTMDEVDAEPGISRQDAPPAVSQRQQFGATTRRPTFNDGPPAPPLLGGLEPQARLRTPNVQREPLAGPPQRFQPQPLTSQEQGRLNTQGRESDARTNAAVAQDRAGFDLNRRLSGPGGLGGAANVGIRERALNGEIPLFQLAGPDLQFFRNNPELMQQAQQAFREKQQRGGGRVQVSDEQQAESDAFKKDLIANPTKRRTGRGILSRDEASAASEQRQQGQFNRQQGIADAQGTELIPDSSSRSRAVQLIRGRAANREVVRDEERAASRRGLSVDQYRTRIDQEKRAFDANLRKLEAETQALGRTPPMTLDEFIVLKEMGMSNEQIIQQHAAKNGVVLPSSATNGTDDAIGGLEDSSKSRLPGRHQPGSVVYRRKTGAGGARGTAVNISGADAEKLKTLERDMVRIIDDLNPENTPSHGRSASGRAGGRAIAARSDDMMGLLQTLRHIKDNGVRRDFSEQVFRKITSEWKSGFISSAVELRLREGFQDAFEALAKGRPISKESLGEIQEWTEHLRSQ